MSNVEIVEVLNKETGERGQIRRSLFENEAINNGILVEVDADQKPYVKELFKSRIEEDSDDKSLDDTSTVDPVLGDTDEVVEIPNPDEEENE